MVGSLTLALGEIQPFAIPFRKPQVSLHFNSQSLLLILLGRDLIGIPTPVQRADSRSGKSRACLGLQCFERVPVQPKTRAQSPSPKIGHIVTELSQLLEAFALQPGPFTREPEVSAILIAFVLDGLDGFLCDHVVRWFRSAYTPGIGAIRGHVIDFVTGD